jgi:tetratricopeptide (TPR) repeat protein
VTLSALAVATPGALSATAKPAPAAKVAPKAAPKVAPRVSPTPAVPAPIAEQLKAVEGLANAQLRPAYAEAQLELAKRYQAHGQTRSALAAARVASQAFDRQVELHKSLSETLVPYERARAERATAHDLGVRRDRANFTIGELARALGDDDTAITHFVMVVQSQPDQPLGQDALAALVAMGVVAPAPSPSPKP